MKYDLLYLAVGAVLGAALRYRMTGQALFYGSLPLSVLLVNVLGSFILGLSSSMVQSWGLDERYVILVGVGFCGSLTTMSSFAFETASLLQLGKVFVAALDVVLNVGASILAVLLGRGLVLMLFGGA